MLPPRHVYSAIVKNTSGKDVTVKATYEVPTSSNTTTTEVVEIAIAAGADGSFAEKTVDFGSASFISNITSFEVAGGVKATGPFVDGPARNVVFVIAADLSVAKQ